MRLTRLKSFRGGWMGEAKRRKLVDSNYGKIRHPHPLAVKLQQRVSESLQSFFQSSYQAQGRGLAIRSTRNRDALDYFSLEELEAETLSGIPSQAAQQIRAVIEQYDPEREGLLFDFNHALADGAIKIQRIRFPFGEV